MAVFERHQHALAQIDAGHVAAGHYGVAQRRAAQIGAFEAGFGQVAAGKVGTEQGARREDRRRPGCAMQQRTAQVGLRQAAPAKVVVREVGELEDGAPATRRMRDKGCVQPKDALKFMTAHRPGLPPGQRDGNPVFQPKGRHCPSPHLLPHSDRWTSMTG